jgi:hypothetical protein
MFRLINETPKSHHAFSAINRVEVNVAEDASLDDMCEAFRCFLLASGFSVTSIEWFNSIDDGVSPYKDESICPVCMQEELIVDSHLKLVDTETSEDDNVFELPTSET